MEIFSFGRIVHHCLWNDINCAHSLEHPSAHAKNRIAPRQSCFLVPYWHFYLMLMHFSCTVFLRKKRHQEQTLVGAKCCQHYFLLFLYSRLFKNWNQERDCKMIIDNWLIGNHRSLIFNFQLSIFNSFHPSSVNFLRFTTCFMLKTAWFQLVLEFAFARSYVCSEILMRQIAIIKCVIILSLRLLHQTLIAGQK